MTPPDGAHVPMPARASLVKGSVGPYLQPVPPNSSNESQSSQASTVPPIAASVSLNSGVSDWLGEESDVPTVFHRPSAFRSPHAPRAFYECKPSPSTGHGCG